MKSVIVVIFFLILTGCVSKKKVDNFYNIEFPDDLNFDTFKEHVFHSTVHKKNHWDVWWKDN